VLRFFHQVKERAVERIHDLANVLAALALPPHFFLPRSKDSHGIFFPLAEALSACQRQTV